MSRNSSNPTLAAEVEPKRDIESSAGASTPAHGEKGEKNRGDVAVRPANHHSLKHMTEAERTEYLSETVLAGEHKYHQLGWIQLVVVLIVEAIALGALSLPAAFATLGMVAGVITTVGIGFIAIYTSYVIGQVKIKYPQVQHYSDIGPLIAGPKYGPFVSGVIATGFVLYLVLLVGSHCLTGTIAFHTITKASLCNVVWGVISMILLFLCALPPSFAEMAVLGYIDFVSIVAAILITLIATGINADNSVGGMSSVDWSAWPKEGTSFADGMVAVTNVVFAYSFAICQFSFMEEMHTPTDFPKAVWTLGLVEIVIYTLTGALGYAFIGQAVKAPALLSAGDTVSRIAFGIALPVIFISGSINTVTSCRFILDRIWANSPIRYVNTPRGWMVWIILISIASVIAFVVAEAIPFFSDLLAIISALFISGFTFYLPGIMWLVLIRQGGYFQGWKNTSLTLLNVGCIIIGLICLGCGTYGAVQDIIISYRDNTVGHSFACN